MHLNTAVSSLMELVNELYEFSEGTVHGPPSRIEPEVGGIERPQTIAAVREAMDALVVMISPFAPHTAEELWQLLGNAESLRGALAFAIRELPGRTEVVVPSKSTERSAHIILGPMRPVTTARVALRQTVKAIRQAKRF